MFYVTALVALAATGFYAERTGWLLVHGNQSRSAVTVRMAHIFVLSSIVAGALTRAVAGDDFAWFHWMLLAALTAKVIGHIGLRGDSPT